MKSNHFQTIISSRKVLEMEAQGKSFDLILPGFFLQCFISHHQFGMSTESAGSVHVFKEASWS